MSTQNAPTAKVEFIDHTGAIDESVHACPECTTDWLDNHGIDLTRDQIKDLLEREIPVCALVDGNPHTMEIRIHPVERCSCDKCGSI